MAASAPRPASRAKRARRGPQAAFGGTPMALGERQRPKSLDPEAGGRRSAWGAGGRRGGRQREQLYTPLPGAPGFQPELRKCELHNFAGSVALKGQADELTVKIGFLSCSSAKCVIASLGLSACNGNCCLYERGLG